MLCKGKVNAIKWLLKEGQLSQRQIARQLRVGRNQVSEIAHGRRPDYEAIRSERQRRRVDAGQPVRIGRCPECGAKARLPCVLCQVRHRARLSPRRKKRAARIVNAALGLQLRLRPKERRRYLALVASRRQREVNTVGEASKDL